MIGDIIDIPLQMYDVVRVAWLLAAERTFQGSPSLSRHLL